MTRRAALLLACGPVALAATVAGQVPAIFRGGVDAVSVSVSVRQGQHPVRGLTAEDFVLTDNGVPQQIAALSFETLPIDVTLVFDVSRSVQGPRLERLRYGVLETAKLLTPADRLRLVAVQHELREIFPFQPGGERPPVDGLTAAGGTALFDGLAAAMMRPAEPDRRQLIVAYTDGQDTISVLGLDAVREIAGHADAVLHVVVPLAGNGRNRQAVPGAAVLHDLATRTGGQLFWVDFAAPLSDAFGRALSEFRTSYVLRYVPRGVSSGGWHEIAVSVPGGTYDVRARRGYGGG